MSYVTAIRGGFLVRGRTRSQRPGGPADHDHRGRGRRGGAEQPGAAVRTSQSVDRRSRPDHGSPASKPGSFGKRREPRSPRDRVRRGEPGGPSAVLRPRRRPVRARRQARSPHRRCRPRRSRWPRPRLADSMRRLKLDVSLAAVDVLEAKAKLLLAEDNLRAARTARAPQRTASGERGDSPARSHAVARGHAAVSERRQDRAAGASARPG